MELLQLRYFCEVARRESFTKAAEEVRVSQPSLSKTIKNLEQELGVELFDRVKNRVVLNEYGKEFYERISKAIYLIDSGVESLKVTPDSENGVISVIVKAGQYLFPPLYDAFSKTHPNIILDVANYSLMQRKLMIEYDFHITATMNSYNDIDFEYLMREEMVVIVNQENRFSQKHLISMEELKEEIFIGGWRGSSNNTIMTSLCHAAGFVPRFNAYYTEMEQIFKSVAAGEGLSIVPFDSLGRLFQEYDNKIAYVYIANPGNYRFIKLCWPKRFYENKRSRLFREYAQTYYRELEDEIMQKKNCVFHNNCITHQDFILEYF